MKNIYLLLLITFLFSCSRETRQQRISRRNFEKDSTRVYVAHRRNPSTVVDEYKRMVDDGEVKSRVITIRDTVIIPAKTIVQYLKPEKVIDKKREVFLLDSIANVITDIAFSNNLTKDSLARVIFKKETALILASKKNCPELSGQYILEKDGRKTVAYFENGDLKEIIQIAGDTVLRDTKVKEVLMPAKPCYPTNQIPIWVWYVIGGLAGGLVLLWFVKR